ncbi:srs domain-containing protein [Neospora caninum Liverpool]|uniref:Srs domain-containing protein n=1 Tax=Neospora caninum (strain Liverpool) TaxID=572307 RepID=F0VCH1_NEOCL|nr:srs domain-containing protein [Neospora caninum Liverpool]CBZ51293.1 srs domain-containing protein [Neospora caninum Liverpool]CEL68607.1 TPA: SRS domain-containing protein [Neospora caninum Liverpool]|eukprot:XP_003881326.1 srs domain-containing protein [Neospora caninum Liverpool]
MAKGQTQKQFFSPISRCDQSYGTFFSRTPLQTALPNGAIVHPALLSSTSAAKVGKSREGSRCSRTRTVPFEYKMGVLPRVLLVIGISITLSSSRAPIAAAGTELSKTSAQTCDNTGGVTVQFPEAGRSVQFKCGSPFDTLVPSDPLYVFVAAAAPQGRNHLGLKGEQEVAEDITVAGHTKKLLRDLYKDATLDHGSGNDSGYTLQIPDTSRTEEGKTLKYFCKRGGKSVLDVAKDACPVTIRIPAKKQEPGTDDSSEDDPQQPENVLTCTAESGKQKATVSKANQTVQFSCDPPATSTLTPEAALKVFDNKDGACTKEVDLSTLVPQARRSEREGNGVYTVTFPQLPSEKQALCYSCSTTGGSGSLRTAACQIHIDVSAATAVSTTTHTTSNATSRVHAAISQAVVGILFVSVAGIACLS